MKSHLAKNPKLMGRCIAKSQKLQRAEKSDVERELKHQQEFETAAGSERESYELIYGAEGDYPAFDY